MFIIDDYCLLLIIIFDYFDVNIVCINADIKQLFFEKHLEKLIWLV